MTRDERYALRWARDYRARHINVIPSSTTDKKPLYRFADRYGWETMFPAEWFTDEAWEANPTTNLQVVLGARWKLLVVDIDGPAAKEVWDGWVRDRQGKELRTWASHRDGGDSYHYWFKVPEWWEGPVVKRVVWKEGPDAKHSAIEILGDRSLIVAPPSFHVKTGRPYRFLPGLNPEVPKMRHPWFAPGWVMNLPAVAPERPKVEFVARRPKLGPRIMLDREHLSRDEVLGRIHDKIGVAQSWGLRVVGRPNARGWAPCRAIDRDDADPSAAIHVETGVYTDRGTGVAMGLPELMEAMGHAHDPRDALQRLAQRYR